MKHALILMPLAVAGCSRPHAVTAARPSTAEPAVLAIDVERGRFVVHKPDGSVAADAELVGAELVAQTEGSVRALVRIDDVFADPNDGKRVLYRLSRQATDGSWVSACDPGPDGLSAGFPVPGRWTQSGEHIDAKDEFEITCTSGAIGKCVRFGYAPWDSAEMWQRHQACTRMVRADYCGTGHPHTKNGMHIDLYDTAGIQLDEPDPGMTFEAGWGAHGAICVKHTRVSEIATLDTLAAECGPSVQLGEACSEEIARADSRLLLMNKSM